MKEKLSYVPLAVLVTIAGLTLFFFLAKQAGTQVRPVGVLGDEVIVGTSLSDIAGGANATSTQLPNTGPARLTIPAIGVDALIEHVGLNAKNEIGIPSNYSNVAWYNRNPRPGEQGNAIIDGHLNDRLSRPAVFWDLEKLTVGDSIIVTDADGTTHTFRVRKTAIYDTYNAPMDEIIGPSTGAHLNLITCTGTWLKNDRMYDKRLVVFTDLVQ